MAIKSSFIGHFFLHKNNIHGTTSFNHLSYVRYFSILSILVLLNSCVTYQSSTFKELYATPENTYTEMYVTLQDKNDDTTYLWLFINNETIQYIKKPKDTMPSCSLSVNIIAENTLQNIIEDSLTKFISEYKRNPKSMMYFSFALSLRKNFPYNIYVQVVDINRGNAQKAIVYYKKPEIPTPSGIYLDSGKTPYFQKWIYAGNSIYIANYEDNAYLHYYDNINVVPPSPFADTDTQYATPSSSRTLPYGIHKMKFDKEGLYVFNFGQKTMTMLCVPPGFPKLYRWEDIVLPIRYITTRREYENIINSPNPRNEFENFFLDITDRDKNAAKKIMRTYYRRVFISNKEFSLTRYGCLTDRGMIYIVLGPPLVVQKQDTVERWFYGSEDSPFTISFVFKKREVLPQVFDYVLERGQEYKFTWYKAVDFLRRGLTYKQTD